MILKNSWFGAIERRTSRRTYQSSKIEAEKADQIRRLLSDINDESGLNFQFVEDGELFLSGFKASYGLISGKPSMIVLAGRRSDPELKRKIGYYGEFAVLECIALSLGTCWIGGSFDRKKTMDMLHLNDGEDLICVLAAGNVSENKNIKERLVSAVNGGKQTFDELLQDKDGELPVWVRCGIEAARLSPSAVNAKPIGYRYRDSKLTAFITKSNRGAEEIDLGISMAHFELGAHHAGQDGVWTKDGDSYTFLPTK